MTPAKEKLAELNQPSLWSGINAYRSDPLIVDLTGLEIGDAIRAVDVPLPEGVELVAQMREATVASIATSSALQSEEEGGTAEGAEGGEAQAAESTEEQ